MEQEVTLTVHYRDVDPMVVHCDDYSHKRFDNGLMFLDCRDEDSLTVAMISLGDTVHIDINHEV